MGDAADIPKAELFRRLGYGGDQARYERTLVEAGLSRPGKARISNTKLGQVKSLLAGRYMRLCQRADCQKMGNVECGGRELVPAESQADCEICAGSVNNFAVDEMIKACARAGWTRLCVVGGSPNTAEELHALTNGRIKLRIVNGTLTRSKRDAESDLLWADRVVIWGATELAHKVSALYRGSHVITIARRGVSELAKGVAESARRAKRT
jgi:hypothetical protein